MFGRYPQKGRHIKKMDTDPAQSPSGATAGAPASGNGSADERLFVLLRTRGHWRPLELALIALSTSGNWGLFWMALALVLWLAGSGHGLALVLLMALFVYATLIINYGIKVMLGRERPLYSQPELKPLVGVPSSKSFPSSHAAMSFAAASVLTFFFPPFFWLFYLVALVMSWSRVYVGVHRPSDVLAGMIVGLAGGGVAALLLGIFASS